MSRLQSVSLAGADVETFGAEDLLLYQAMHGAKHLWRRLEWISCLAESLRATRRSTGTRSSIAQRKHTQHASSRLACDSSKSFQTRRSIRSFRYQSIRQNDATHGDADSRAALHHVRPAESTETNLYNLRIMDRKRDALVSALRSIFVPTLPDWQSLALPASLHSLYYAIAR
jgi:hypothetical protein